MFKTTLAAGAFALLTVFSTTLPTYAAGVNPAGGPAWRPQWLLP